MNIFSTSVNELQSSGQSAFFLDGTNNCNLVSLVSTSALSDEVFSFTVFSGLPTRPAAQVFTPPFCAPSPPPANGILVQQWSNPACSGSSAAQRVISTCTGPDSQGLYFFPASCSNGFISLQYFSNPSCLGNRVKTTPVENGRCLNAGVSGFSYSWTGYCSPYVTPPNALIAQQWTNSDCSGPNTNQQVINSCSGPDSRTGLYYLPASCRNGFISLQYYNNTACLGAPTRTSNIPHQTCVAVGNQTSVSYSWTSNCSVSPTSNNPSTLLYYTPFSNGACMGPSDGTNLTGTYGNPGSSCTLFPNGYYASGTCNGTGGFFTVYSDPACSAPVASYRFKNGDCTVLSPTSSAIYYCSPIAASTPMPITSTPIISTTMVPGTPMPPRTSAPSSTSPQCCYLGGDGTAVLQGGAAIDINNGLGTRFYSNSMLVLDPASQALAVLINGSTSNQASAGWVISQNQTSQTLTRWYVDPQAPGVVQCSTSVVNLPTKFVSGFALCPGIYIYKSVCMYLYVYVYVFICFIHILCVC